MPATRSSIEVEIFEDAEVAALGAGRHLADCLTSGGRQRFAATRSFALAGGSTPARTYELLAAMPVPWGSDDSPVR